MAVSRNDWDIIPSGSSDRLVNLSWITGKVRRGDAYTILNDLGRRFNAEVEPIIKSHSWGYANRPVRGYASIPSEHATGTAVDFNAPAHPIGKKNTFSLFKRARIRKLVKSYDGAVRWGGEWSRPDDMHFELIGGAAKIKKVAAKLTAGAVTPAKTPKATATPKRAPKPAKAPSKAVQAKLKGMGYRKRGFAEVRAFQKAHKLWEDGDWGYKTEAKYQENIRLQNALKKMKGVPDNWKSDGFIGATSTKWINYTLKRQGWTRSNLIANLMKVKAW